MNLKGIILLLILFNLQMSRAGNINSGFPDRPRYITGDLFSSDDTLNITLSGNLSKLFDDRGDDPQYYPVLMKYTNKDGSPDSIEISVKTRGHFRKAPGNCTYPPLLLNFSEASLHGNSLFSGQDKLKLVTPCRGDQYVVREYLVYKIYNLVSEMSFKARLVRVVYQDSQRKKSSEPLYGILLEEDKNMAARNHSVVIDRQLVKPETTRRKEFLEMAVFEYLIGNTDWSVQYLQNVRLIGKDSLSMPVTVPYDFDHAGIVSAPYARPAEELSMISVRQRRYRGFCMQDMNGFKEVFEIFNRLKPDIYNIYSQNALLDEKYIASTIKYLDGFYDTINDPEKSTSEFTYPCLKGGTGNVVIKGLK